jgi:hypothetical protein
MEKYILNNMNELDINGIRRLPEIEEIISSVPAFGRTWGKCKESKLRGSHITLISEKEIVLIIGSSKKNDFRICQFKKAKKTELGSRILKIFKEKKIPIQE